MPALKNPKHEKTVQLKVKGYNQRQAYKEGFGVDYSDDAIDNKASKFFARGEVQARYEELVNELKDSTIMTAKERMKWLTDVINGTEKETTYLSVNGEQTPIEKTADLNTKIKALDTLNKMDNTYQQNVKISGSLNNPFDGMSTEELRDILRKLEND